MIAFSLLIKKYLSLEFYKILYLSIFPQSRNYTLFLAIILISSEKSFEIFSEFATFHYMALDMMLICYLYTQIKCSCHSRLARSWIIYLFLQYQYYYLYFIYLKKKFVFRPYLLEIIFIFKFVIKLVVFDIIVIVKIYFL